MFSFCNCNKHVTKCKEQQLNKFTQRMRCRSNFPVLHNKNNTIKTNNCLRIERQKQNERIRSSRYADNRGTKNSVYNFTRHAEKTGVREQASERERERDLCSSAVCERERETNCCAGMCLPFGWPWKFSCTGCTFCCCCVPYAELHFQCQAKKQK